MSISRVAPLSIRIQGCGKHKLGILGERIDDLRYSRGNFHVAGMQIAVRQPVAVKCCEPIKKTVTKSLEFFRIRMGSVEPIGESYSGNILHYQGELWLSGGTSVGAHKTLRGDHSHDVWMV